MPGEQSDHREQEQLARPTLRERQQARVGQPVSASRISEAATAAGHPLRANSFALSTLFWYTALARSTPLRQATEQ